MQPTFNPWLGYFDLIDYVDKFIFLDTVQLNRRSWQVRNKLKLGNRSYMFTLPVKRLSHRYKETINLIKFSEPKKTKKRLYRTLQLNYRKAKFFDEVNSFIEEIVLFETEFLAEYNINFITSIAKKLLYTTEMITLSKIDFAFNSSKGNLILDICRFFSASDYISPIGSKTYLNDEIKKFKNANILIYYQKYHHPTYNQLGNNFIPYIGIVDLLYNEGFENSKKIILNGRCYEKAY